ncbi:hypothetical protein PISMIDRAFT_680372 [Pisolithus microcarpus 441]|uniref:Uncharacterized protein n=1 Tax=Pisolithus microcarpus 441 TaxID=765257 RepID=A0A0C9Z8I6_9AGAM|nr:hypothetical protein PISMIDRAFT_680372 [Pisolithus microcarpus 441]
MSTRKFLFKHWSSLWNRNIERFYGSLTGLKFFLFTPLPCKLLVSARSRFPKLDQRKSAFSLHPTDEQLSNL